MCVAILLLVFVVSQDSFSRLFSPLCLCLTKVTYISSMRICSSHDGTRLKIMVIFDWNILYERDEGKKTVTLLTSFQQSHFKKRV